MFFCQPDDIGSVVHQCIPNGKLWLNLIHHCDIVLKHAYTVYIYIDMCLSICVCLCRCVDWTQMQPSTMDYRASAASAASGDLPFSWHSTTMHHGHELGTCVFGAFK